MSAITLEQAEAQLQDYLNAEVKVLSGLVVEMNGRRLTLANLAEIQLGIENWNQLCLRRPWGVVLAITQALSSPPFTPKASPAICC